MAEAVAHQLQQLGALVPEPPHGRAAHRALGRRLRRAEVDALHDRGELAVPACAAAASNRVRVTLR